MNMKFKKSTDENFAPDDSIKSIKPHVPFYAAPGCKVIKTWEEDFVDRVGNRAVLTKAEYSDKKGKIHEFVKLVRWLP